MNKKGLTKEEFFSKISGRASYLTPGLVEEVYREMVRMAVVELRLHKEVKFPDFGTLKLTKHKERMSIDINTKTKVFMPAFFSLKFQPDYKLKTYFRNFGDSEENLQKIINPEQKL